MHVNNALKGFDLDPNRRVCTRCIYDDRVSYITFDADGVCNYCHQLNGLMEKFGTAQPKGHSIFEDKLEEMKRAGYGKPYDCIIGVSGGTDSSFLIHKAVKEWGLRPLAVHYDNTWNSAVATQNISKILRPLGVDLHTHVVNNIEADDIFRAFFRAGVAEIEASTDLALPEVSFRAAWKYGIKFTLDGHSFVTEGVTPLGRNYFDGKYIRSIHKAFGTRKMSTYPLMTFERFLFWAIAARIQRIQPFWYIKYNKEEARTLLEREYGWEYYGGHHLENRMTAFYHSVYLPQKFNSDLRNNTLSALVRNGKMRRVDAWAKYNEQPHIEDELISYLQKRLGLSDQEYLSTMDETPRDWHEFPTYKKRFELMRPLFKILVNANLVPRSFYLKYCFPTKKQG